LLALLLQVRLLLALVYSVAAADYSTAAEHEPQFEESCRARGAANVKLAPAFESGHRLNHSA